MLFSVSGSPEFPCPWAQPPIVLGVLWQDPLHLPRQGEEVEETEGATQGPALGSQIRALCRQAQVCLPGPVLLVLIIGKCNLDD